MCVWGGVCVWKKGLENFAILAMNLCLSTILLKENKFCKVFLRDQERKKGLKNVQRTVNASHSG